ncbi:MAG: NAD(P)-dependent oxidoreductase [Bacteroidia bacterium]|nr:NAD(P)-dependent oxidoreductase [Bacteroidia bacterium]
MKLKILLTGASGSVGYEVLKQLISQRNRFEITVFDLKTPKSEKLLKKFKNDIRLFYGDITDPDATTEASKNQDFIIHLAALIPPAAYENKTLTEKINVGGTKNLITNLEKYSPNAFFAYSSSVATYGDRLKDPYIKVTDPLKPSLGDYYAETKIMAEDIIRSSKLRWTIFRLSAIMGAGNHKISGLMFLMPLETPVEITTPEDTARAFVNAIDHQEELLRKTFNLGGGEKNRIIYTNLLQKSFDIYGLGKLNFPEGAFAKRNYHCAYYADSDDLENILHFRRDTIDTYFRKVEASVPSFQRFFTQLVSGMVKKSLLKKSEPYAAYKSGDKEKMKYYF